MTITKMTDSTKDSTNKDAEEKVQSETVQKLLKPSASYSLTLRVKLKNMPGMLGKITSLIGSRGGDLGAIDIESFE